MKKVGGLILGLVLLFSLTPLVFAQNNFDSTAQTFASKAVGLFSGINLGAQNFTLILFGILVWMLVYSAIRNMDMFRGYNGGIFSAVFALIITFLAFYGLPAGYIDSVLVQYQTLGATIITIIPFVIMFYFTTSVIRNEYVARLAWLVYIVYYFSLFVYKIDIGTGPVFSVENIPYFAGIIMGILVFVFMVVFRRFFFKISLESDEEKAERTVRRGAAGYRAGAKGLDELDRAGAS